MEGIKTTTTTHQLAGINQSKQCREKEFKLVQVTKTNNSLKKMYYYKINLFSRKMKEGKDLLKLPKNV